MTKTFALAALLAATAFTPAFAQEEPQERRIEEAATAAEPTPIPQRVMVEMAQRERGERGPRPDRGGNNGDNNGGSERPAWNGGQGRPDGGWQRREQATPVYQATPAQVQAPQPQQQQVPPAQSRWNRGDAGVEPDWQGRTRGDWSGRRQNQDNPNGQDRQPGWSRPTPPVVAVPIPAQPQGNWQNRDQRRDTWRNGNGIGNGGVVVQRPDDRRWNGNNGWNGQNRNDGRWNERRRNDGQWNGNRRNDTWRNDSWRDNGHNNSWRNDSWRSNNRFDQRSQWQNQYRGWNRSWNNDWRRDQRYDWQRHRYSNRSLFRNDRYFAPYGWDYGYRRFSIGFSLSYLLYDQQYWIDDPYSYRLPPVYGPYRWVRYYDDVLLVDLRTGQVTDAIHNFFG